MRKDTRLSPLFRTASDGKLGGAWERGYVEVASVSVVLKESQSDAVELKPWMTISDLYGRSTVKFSVND